MAKMTSKERLLAAIRHEETDRVPISPRMNIWAGDKYGGFDWRQQLKIAEDYGTDPLIWIDYDIPEYIMHPFSGTYRELIGVSVEINIKNLGEASEVSRRFETPAGTLTDCVFLPHPHSSYGSSPSPVNREPLVKNIADVERLAFLLAPPEGHIMNIREMAEEIGSRGLLEIHPISGPSMVLNILGQTEAMLIYYDDPELFRAMITLFGDYGRRQTKALLEQGAELIFASWHNLGISSGWSPEFFREVAKPLVAKEAELVHSYGAVYSYFDNGRLRAILPDIAEAGADLVSSLCPAPMGDIDLAEAKAAFGDRLCLHGNVDAINVVQRGSPEDVREAVRKNIEAGAPGSGYILGNSDCFFSDTPDENIRSFFEAAHEYA